MNTNEQLLQLALRAVLHKGDQDGFSKIILKQLDDVDRALVRTLPVLTEEDRWRCDHWIIGHRHINLPTLDMASATFQLMAARILNMPEDGFKDEFIQYVLARGLTWEGESTEEEKQMKHLLQLALLAVPDVGDQDHIARHVLKQLNDVNLALAHIPSLLREEVQRRSDAWIAENRHAILPTLNTASGTFRLMTGEILDMPEGSFKDKFIQYVLARALDERAWNLITEPVDLDALRAEAERAESENL